ncbi:hypothetical protein V6N12_018614 [Hibiscus sabdariffa]|uniref:Retrovirus-related Pol polyprotein from transposon TNT 1-94-like beta-barrel domain-containing protein n=1 Tax=Hibiscus sabdariffa TaxID=183260 RepID=A0ABR2AK36_9ROSI
MQRKTISPYDITSSDNLGSKGRGGVEANVVQASTTEVMGNDIISDSDKTAITGLSNEQWETLRTLLNGAKMGTNEKMAGNRSSMHWIIDSGASHHMTGCLECLSDVRDVIGCPVGLPNRNQIAVTKEGTMVFDNKLTLNHVLYVPSLMCNLISLSQLLDETNCVAQFTDKFCVIQDRTSGMLIGAGEQRGGLYFFHTMVTTTAMKMSGQSSFDMWHKRLGHPSSKVVELIPNVVFCELEFPYMTNIGSINLNGGNENGDVVVLPQENNDIVVETRSEECDNDEVRGMQCRMKIMKCWAVAFEIKYHPHVCEIL